VKPKPVDLDRNVEIGSAAALATMDVALAQLRAVLREVEGGGVTYDDDKEAGE
jgi:hypothetical protein